VFNSVLEAARSAAWGVAKLGVIAALISTLAAAALFFLTLAAFIWAEGEFGALVAAAGLGVFFLALALAFVTVVWSQRRPRSSPTELQAMEKAERNPTAEIFCRFQQLIQCGGNMDISHWLSPG
jgi:membrane protein implicated in regulation of membrane protease activity